MQQRENRQFRKRRGTMLACALTVAALAAFATLAGSSTQAGATAQGTPGLPATITVTNTEDNGSGSLRAAIAQAAPGDTINFTVTGAINLTSATLTINKDLTITGPGADDLSVERNSTAPDFKIFTVETGATVAISGLSISGGRAVATTGDAGVGGGIDNGGTLTLDSCHLINNFAHQGGGLHNRGTMVIKHCQVAANVSEGKGGGVSNDGMMTISNSSINHNLAGFLIDSPGAGIANTGTLTIIDSNIASNTLYLLTTGDGAGAGIANSGTLTVNKTTLANNLARTYGGALYNSGYAVINNSTIASNFSGAGRHPSAARGGAIYNDGGDLSINASTITRNEVDTRHSDSLPTERVRGGGIYNNSGTVSVATSIIAGNSVTISHNQDIGGAFISKGYNLIGVVDGGAGFSNGVQHDQIGTESKPLDPKVGRVRDNGGPTRTAALLCGSPAIDAGDDGVSEPPLNLATDQRGRARRAGSHVDIGAFEVQPDDETCRTLSISDAVVVEGDAGTKNAVFTVTLSAATADGVTFNYSIFGDSARANEDFTPTPPFDSGFVIIAGGATSRTINVPIIGDRIYEPDETFTVALTRVTNAVITRAQGVGTITNDDPPPVLQFSAADYQVNETGGSVLVTITRTGNMLGEVLVNYATVADSADLPCNDTTTAPNTASARCDYTTIIDKLFLHHNQTELSFAVPIIDDAHPEQAESFKVMFSVSSGAPLDTLRQATVTIVDNDTGAGKNPIDDSAFFVRQHYLDFLNREPEQTGFDAWMSVLNRCPNRFNFDPASTSVACDRITVSASFFNSPEFRARAYFVYRFYRVALNRRPHYDEMIRDIRSLAGLTDLEAVGSRTGYHPTWAEWPEVRARYDALTDAEYVGALFDRYVGRGNIPRDQRLSRDTLIVILQTGLLTRADILFRIVLSREVDAVEYNGAFVAMQYFGYLRRDADETGYAAWLNYLNTHPGDYRTMVNGFLNSQEYRLRFGAPQ